MADKTDDIARYRKGEMSPEEMHAFEKKASSDVFVQDALEGAELISASDFEADTESLTGKIRNRVIGFRTYFYWTIRTAAALTLLAVATFLIVNYQDDPTPLPTSEEEAVSPPQALKPETLAAEEKDADPLEDPLGPSLQKPSQEIAGTQEESGAGEDRQPVDMIVSDSRESAKSEVDDKAKSEEIATLESKSVSPAFADTIVTAPQGRAIARPENERAAGVQKESLEPAVLITGRVTDTQNHPIPGTNVRLSDSRVGTVTDEQGKYQLSVPSVPSSVTFSNVGYESKEVPATQSPVDVTLQEGEPERMEMALSYSDDLRKKSPASRTLLFPEPAGGRGAFDQYLKSGIRYPDAALQNKIEGRVVVDFTVDGAGKPHSFVTIKSIGYGCEGELIRLITQGPTWLPAMKDGVAIPVTVRVKYRFVLP